MVFDLELKSDHGVSVDITGDRDLAAILHSEAAKPNNTLLDKGTHQLSARKASPTEDVDMADVEPSGTSQDNKGHQDRSATYYRRHPLSVSLTIKGEGMPRWRSFVIEL